MNLLSIFKGKIGQDNKSREMKISEIFTDPYFSTVFPISYETKKMIVSSIKKMGFDRSQPIAVWFCIDKWLVIDGHTRLEAAKEAGLTTIFVCIMNFASQEEALAYCYRRQVERRNLSQAEILSAVQFLKPKEKKDGSGRSVENLAKALGTSASTLTHATTVNKRASEEDKEAIKQGKKTINEIYVKVKGTKKDLPIEVVPFMPEFLGTTKILKKPELAPNSDSKEDQQGTREAKSSEHSPINSAKKVKIAEIIAFLTLKNEMMSVQLLKEKYGQQSELLNEF